MNYIEMMPTLIVATVLSGIYFPIPALVGVWGALLGRILFAIGYKKGPAMRKPGAMLLILCTVMMLFLSIASVAINLSKFSA